MLSSSLWTIRFFAASLSAAAALAQGACPVNAVFVGLQDQVRGYALRSSGSTTPCQVLQGPATALSTARAIAFSKNRYLHVAQFLTNSTVDIFAPDASGNQPPFRSFTVSENDLVSIAVDSKINDFVLSIRQPNLPIFVVPAGATGYQGNATVITDPNIQQYQAIATDRDDNLLAAGYDSSGNARIDTYRTSMSLTAPQMIRSLTGPGTGLLRGAGTFGTNDLSIALDPESQELAVYNTTADHTVIQVSIFARGASGNVAPSRVISGPLTGIGAPGYAGAGKISVSADGRLFVAESGGRILVFAAGASGNTAPAQIITDPALGSAGQGGIAVRSCLCQ